MTRTGRQHVKGGKRGRFDGVRPGAISFRLLAAVRRRAITLLRALESAGDRALSLSLFRAGEFLRHPLPRRVRVQKSGELSASSRAVERDLPSDLQDFNALPSMQRQLVSRSFSGLRSLRAFFLAPQLISEHAPLMTERLQERPRPLNRSPQRYGGAP